MKNKFELTDFINVKTVDTTKADLVNRFKARRKEMKLSQIELANKSNVSYASIRRFETSGEISLDSLMKLAIAMDMISDFDNLFVKSKVTSIKDL